LIYIAAEKRLLLLHSYTLTSHHPVRTAVPREQQSYVVRCHSYF